MTENFSEVLDGTRCMECDGPVGPEVGYPRLCKKCEKLCREMSIETMCSFCGVSATKVLFMIVVPKTDPRVAICDECIESCFTQLQNHVKETLSHLVSENKTLSKKDN